MALLAPWADPARRAPTRLDGLHRVRSYSTISGDWGPPLVYNRRLAHRSDARALTPYDGATAERVTRDWTRRGEWLQSPITGQWVPVAAALAARPSMRLGRRAFLGTLGMLAAARLASAANFSGSRQGVLTTHHAALTFASTTVALDSAYLFQTAARDALGARVMLNVNKTLSLVYYFITATAGTAANIDDHNLELRNDNGAATAPSTTLHTSASMNPNADAAVVGWHQFNPADFAMVKGTVYWVIVGDADGNGTDFATVLAGTNAYAAGLQDVATSTDGFTTASIVAARFPSIILAFTDGQRLGCSLTSAPANASNTNRRGLYWNAAFTEDIKIFGFVYTAGTANITSGEIYENIATAPGGTAIASIGAYGTSTHLFDPYVIDKAAVIRIVAVLGTATTSPHKFVIGVTNGHDAVLRTARKAGGALYWSEANGTTDWANDDQNGSPNFLLYLEDLVEIPAGGGGGGIIGG
jgi:hypothetical protein